MHADTAGARQASSRPSGTVTFLFTDIEGSTVRWERHRAAMEDAVRRHDALVREAIEAHGGYVFKTIGDAFCAAFPRPSEALASAVAAQTSLAAQDFSAVDGLHVRMALHMGSADERDADYFGPAVNRVARLLGIAHGGQILLSGITADMSAEKLPAATSLQDLGTHRLKDLERPERVYQLDVPDARTAFPPLRSLDVIPNNLPLELTAFVSREDEVAEIVALVRAHHLVTLTGAGGIGKTRTSLQAAAELLDAYPDGVWFVELAALSDGRLIPSTIASALGLRVSGDDHLRSLATVLRPLNVLILLDNCEHLIDDVARVVAALLQSCADVSVLASSRQALGIAGESAFRMPSLRFPEADIAATLSAAEALEYGAIALFDTRAKAVQHSFVLSDANVRVVADICRRLDGIALAIELAAARVVVMSPQHVSQRLDERFRLLTGGSRTAVPRQQTLRALIDWSYDLLSGEERAVLRRLSAFAGGCTLEAAEFLCGDASNESLDVFDALASLVEKSLVVAETGDEASRYRLLESTRAYAFERLIAAGELESTRRRHAEWYARFSRDIFRTGGAHTTLQALAVSLRADLDNARAAMHWALDASAEPEIAGSIALGFYALWNYGGYSSEGTSWVERALAALGDEGEPLLVGHLWRLLAELSLARKTVDAAERAITAFEQIDDPQPLAHAYCALSFGYRQTGELDASIRAAERALEIVRESGAEGTPLHARALGTLATTLNVLQRVDEARPLFLRTIEIHERKNDYWRSLGIRLNLAELEFRAGSVGKAVAIANEALAIAERAGDRRVQTPILVNLAGYLIAAGDAATARQYALQGLELARRVQLKLQLHVALQHVATVAALQGDTRTAGHVLGYVDAWNAQAEIALDFTEKTCRDIAVGSLEQQLSAGELRALLDAGALLTEDQAVEEAT